MLFSKDSNKLEHFFPCWNSKNYYQCCCFSSFRSALLFSGSKQPRPDIFIGLLEKFFFDLARTSSATSHNVHALK